MVAASKNNKTATKKEKEKEHKMEKQTLRVQRGVIDLTTFEDVLLVKVGEFEPVANQHEALARVSNNAEKFLEVINIGLKALAQQALRMSGENWHTFDDKGEVNGEFTGIPADSKVVNGTVLTLAKTVFGYGDVDSPEHRKAAKDKAKEFIKSNETIKNGLMKSAALRDEE